MTVEKKEKKDLLESLIQEMPLSAITGKDEKEKPRGDEQYKKSTADWESQIRSIEPWSKSNPLKRRAKEESGQTRRNRRNTKILQNTKILIMKKSFCCKSHHMSCE